MGLIAEIHNDLQKGALQLILEHRDRMFAEAVRLCGDIQEAEDLVCRTFARALAKLDKFDAEGSLYVWLKTIMTNLRRDDLRHPVQRGTTPFDPQLFEVLGGEDWRADEELLRRSDSEALREAMERLDPEYKKVLVMHYFGELPAKSIALALKVPLGTVLWRLSIARKILAKDLGEKLGKVKKPLAVLGAVLLGAGVLWGAAVSPLGDWARKLLVSSEPSALGLTPNEKLTQTDKKGEGEVNIGSVKKVAVAAVASVALQSNSLSGQMAAGAVEANLAWETGTYDPAGWQPSENNILAGNAPSFTGSYYTENPRTASSANPGVLVDGIVPGVSDSALWGVGNNQELTWEFEEPVVIESISLFSRWSDNGRGGISVASVWVKPSGGDGFVNVGAPPVSTSGNPTHFATLSDSSGRFLAADVVALQIVFGSQQNNGTGCAEIEAVGFKSQALTIAGDPSECGSPTPSYGVFVNLPESGSFTATAPASWTSEDEKTQASCAGWRLEREDGTVTSGDGNSATFDDAAELKKATLTWCWNVSYKTTASVSGEGGTAEAKQEDVARGGTARFTATPEPGYAVAWSGDSLEGTMFGNELVLENVQGPVEVVATFFKPFPSAGELKGPYATFAHRTSIVFDGYAGEETLCDFPALVRVSEGSGGFRYAQCVAGGGRDVRFTLADGVELPSEVAEWNPQGESAFWVRLPVLKGRDTRIVMHWGAANPPARELAGSVWSEDYNGVWSFEDEKRALRDSTRRGQHGIASFDSDRSEGVVGKARTFSYNASATGSSGYVFAGHAHDDVQFKAKVITWECWYRRTGSLDGKSHVLMKTYADGGYKGARVIIGDTGLASVQYDSTAVSGLPSAALDEWHHVMMSVDGVKVYVYTDGVKTAQGNSFVSQDRWWLNSIRDASLVFGFTRSIDSSTYPFAGQLDEAKVSRVCRSQDYALAVYSNVAHNASFLTFESASGASSLTVTGDENLPVAGATSPAYGVYPADMSIDVSAVATCEQGGVRWVREGYTLSADGKEIASGDGGAVQVNWPAGAKDVVVRWHWRRQYAVTVAGDASCAVEPEGTAWYDAGTALAVTAKVEGVGRAFYAWRGNCPTLEVFQAGITLPVDRPRSVTAVSGKAFYAEAGVNTLSNAVASVDEYPAVVLAGPGTYTFTHGGGAYIATLTNCIAVRSVGGAAVTVIDGEKADDRCLFKLTSAGAFVGGFTFVNQRMKRDYDSNTPFIVLNPGHVGDCRFVDGVIAGCSSSLVDDKAGGWVRNCIFTGCTSHGSSYGQPYLRVRTAQVEGCKFFDNANMDRAGVNVTHEGTGPSAVFRNCVFARNSAMSGLSGGAVLSSSGGAYKRSFVLFENCLFVDNAVKGQGKGGAICSNDGTVNYPGVSLVNCIFDGNTAAGGASFGNDVYGCCSMVNCAGTGIEAENGSLTVAPVFVDRANGAFHVTGLSPTRDAGAAVEQAMTPGAKDLGGAARVVNGKIDIGPYEYEGGAEPFGVNVVPDVAKGTGSLTVTFAVQLSGDTEGVTYDWDFGDGTTSDEAAPVHAYADGGYFTVRLTVRNGADETATFTGEKLIKVIPRVCYVRPNCENPVEPYVTPETAAKTLADALSVATDTINVDGTVTISAITEILTPLTICGESQTTSVLSVGPVGDNSVFKLTAPGTMLCNLTVKTAGLPYFWNTTPVVAGAGTTVSNCVFTGTGLRPLMLTGGTVVDSVFRNFTSGHDSGTAAITVSAGGSVIDRCIITNNVAGRAGWDYGHRSMGVYVGDAYTPATVIRNSLFANNRGVWNGTPNASQKTTNVCATAVYTKGNTLIENCTVAKSSTYQSTGDRTAGFTVAGPGVEIVNTISWGTVVTNKDIGGVERVIDIYVDEGVKCDIRRSCAMGLEYAHGNVATNPKFRKPEKDDFRIRPNSPCFNGGELWDGIETAVDLDGNPRLRWKRPDMGCYECQRGGGMMLLVK